MKTEEKNKFFDKIAIATGVNDVDSIRHIYYAIINTILNDLRTEKEANLPDFCKIKLKLTPPRMALDVRSKQIKPLEARTVVKFIGDYRLKSYFKNFR